MKSRRMIVIALACFAAIATAGWSIWKFENSKNNSDIVLYGNVDIREVNLGFRVSGRVAKIYKDEGDPIKAGDILAVLDEKPYRHQLEQEQANYNSLKSVRDMKRSGYRVEEIAQMEATVAERQAIFENAQREFARQQQLLAKRVVAQREYDDSAAQYRQDAARLAEARENLRKLKAGFRVEEIAQAEADAERAKAVMQSAQTDLEDTVLIAPEDGVVMTRAVEPGSIVQAGTTAFTVNLEKPVWVRAYVSEPLLGSIRPGRKVQVLSDFNPQKAFNGQIGYVSPRAEFTPKSVETEDLRTSLVYRFRVVITDSDGSLRQGMPVTVHIKRN